VTVAAGILDTWQQSPFMSIAGMFVKVRPLSMRNRATYGHPSGTPDISGPAPGLEANRRFLKNLPLVQHCTIGKRGVLRAFVIASATSLRGIFDAFAGRV
jgi:hypothetical protein